MEESKVCLVVLIGLPGSGKSSFSDVYSDFLSTKSLFCIKVCYDKLIPLEAQAEMKEEEGRWKVERSKIVDAVTHVVKIIKDGEDSTDVECPYLEKIVDSDSVQTKCERTVILIDDNNYLPSMRYDYYQLARTFKLGFAQIYFNTELVLCKNLNRKRESKDQVPEEVIMKMAAKLEPPNPFTNKWEAFSFTLPVQEGVDHNLDLVDSIVEAATNNPVTPVETVNEEEREKDRVACSASLVHQADKCLRGLVNRRMGELRNQGLSKEDLKGASHNIYSVKGEVLEDLKTGLTKLERELVESVQKREDGSGDRLAEEIEQLFNLKLQVS